MTSNAKWSRSYQGRLALNFSSYVSCECTNSFIRIEIPYNAKKIVQFFWFRLSNEKWILSSTNQWIFFFFLHQRLIWKVTLQLLLVIEKYYYANMEYLSIEKHCYANMKYLSTKYISSNVALFTEIKDIHYMYLIFNIFCYI